VPGYRNTVVTRNGALMSAVVHESRNGMMEGAIMGETRSSTRCGDKDA
jgi:hypothetical protein